MNRLTTRPHRASLARLALAGLSSTLAAGPAAAAEVVWDGHYRARADYFNSLSLSRDNPNAEGAALTVDHRLRLQPGWLVSDRVSVYTQVDLLPYTLWGQDPVEETDPRTGESEALIYADGLQPPTTDEGGATFQNLRVTRLWGELNTNWGQVRMGRVPVEWGTGMVFHAGNEEDSEFGDTADRIQVSGRAGEVFLMGGFETRYEGFVAEPDDYNAVVGAVMYNAETARVGMYSTYRWHSYDESKVGLWLGDLYGKAALGPIDVAAEFAAIVGSGDLSTGANDVSITSFGANLQARARFDRLRLGFDFGFAGGDGDTTDSKLHTFTYDPDFNVSLLLFEEPMPILEAAVMNESNDGRDTDAVQSGYAISNAVFVRPQVGWQLREDLSADLALFAAQQAKVSSSSDADRKGYGTELDLSVRYEPLPHFAATGAAGVFLPGKFYSLYEHDELGANFDSPAYGARLMGTFSF